MEGQKLTRGCDCPRCSKGKLTLEAVTPLRRPVGQSKLYFRCNECRTVIEDIQDDRFRH